MAAAKKRWFKIAAPKYFGDRLVGETLSVDPKTLEGKKLTVNLVTLTDNMKRQNTEVTLLINAVEGDAAQTLVHGMRLIPTSIRRMIRKGRTRLDQTIHAITSKEEIITIKTLLVTRKVVQGGVTAAINRETRRFILDYVASRDFNALSEEMIDGRLQKELRQKVNKLYPLRSCDIREFKLEDNLKSTEQRRIQAEVAKAKAEPLPIVEEEPEVLEEEA